MKDTLRHEQIPELLARLGELLEHGGRSESIVVVGGAALNMLGVVQRSTVDIDVIAVGKAPDRAGNRSIVVTSVLPLELQEAAARLARDFDLPPGWINAAAATESGIQLPPGFAERIEWRQYGGLWLGLPGRQDLIALKLHAAADSDRNSRHVGDLIALRPSGEELDQAARWVATQDAGTEFRKILREVVRHVASRTS